jgi:hypothetical protein
VTDVKGEIEGVGLLLEHLRAEPLVAGVHMASFLEKYSSSEKTFDSISLSGTCPSDFSFEEDNFLQKVIEGILQYIDKR